jgi:hypothetical protein
MLSAQAPSLYDVATHLANNEPTRMSDGWPTPTSCPGYPGDTSSTARVVFGYRSARPRHPAATQEVFATKEASQDDLTQAVWRGRHEVSVPAAVANQYARRMVGVRVGAVIRLLRELDAIVLVLAAGESAAAWTDQPRRGCAFELNRFHVRIGVWRTQGPELERIPGTPGVDCLVPETASKWIQISGVLGASNPLTGLPCYAGPAMLRTADGPQQLWRVWDDRALAVKVTNAGVRVVTGRIIPDVSQPTGVKLGSEFIDYFPGDGRATVAVESEGQPAYLVQLQFAKGRPAAGRAYCVTDSKQIVCVATGSVGRPDQLSELFESFSTLSAVMMTREQDRGERGAWTSEPSGGQREQDETLRANCKASNQMAQEIVGCWLRRLGDSLCGGRPVEEWRAATTALTECLDELDRGSVFAGHMAGDLPPPTPHTWVGHIRYLRHRVYGCRYDYKARVRVVAVKNDMALVEADDRPGQPGDRLVPLSALASEPPIMPAGYACGKNVWVALGDMVCRAIVVGGTDRVAYLSSALVSDVFGCAELSAMEVSRPADTEYRLSSCDVMPTWGEIGSIFSYPSFGSPQLRIGAELRCLVDVGRLCHPSGEATTHQTLGCRVRVTGYHAECSQPECRTCLRISAGFHNHNRSGSQSYMIESDDPTWAAVERETGPVRLSDRMLGFMPSEPDLLGSVVRSDGYAVVCGGGKAVTGHDLLHLVHVLEERAPDQILYSCVSAGQVKAVDPAEAADVLQRERRMQRGRHASRNASPAELALQEELIADEQATTAKASKSERRAGARRAARQRQAVNHHRWRNVVGPVSAAVQSAPLRAELVAAGSRVSADLANLDRLLRLYAPGLRTCPLSHETLDDPVVATNGHVYNALNLKHCLTEWPDAKLPTSGPVEPQLALLQRLR